MRRDVTVIGTAVIDVIGYAKRRPREGETVVGTGYEVAAGGKGLNQAIAASRAGCASHLVASIGADEFGARLSGVLDGNGVGRDAVAVRGGLPTGVGLPVVTEDGQNSIVIVPGASSTIGKGQHRWMKEALNSQTVFLSQCELSDEVIEPALRNAADKGALVILNPAPARDIARLVDHIDVLVPNEHEAADLTGVSSPEAAARQLAGWKHGLSVVVTCGDRGAVVFENGESRWVSAPQVEVLDTVGAGDVFCGYLAAGIAEGMPFVEASELAVRAASISVGRRGAALSAPHRPELAESRAK